MLGKNHRLPGLLCLLLQTACSRQNPEIPSGTSWASVLTNSLDLTRLAQTVEPHEKSMHFSSASSPDKTGLAHLAPQIFGDMDHGFFLCVEEHADYTDAILAEANGPGMISWIWSANPSGELLLYIDNMETPALQMPFRDFLDGKFLPVRYPYSATTSKGHNLHFPIIHSTGFKMIIRVPKKEQLATLYYQIAWNALDPALEIHPFFPDRLDDQKPLLKSIAEQMLDEPPTATPEQNLTIPAQTGKTIFSAETSGTICSLSLNGKLSELRLKAFWDGHETPSINCPLHLLFGVSPDFENTESLPTSVDGSKATLRWPMPFGPNSRIVLINETESDVSLKIGFQTSGQTAPLRFHAEHRVFENLQTDAANILNLAEASGPGRIVGCTINVTSRTDQWWGEGDQLIWLDKSDNPAWQGTGTEDYFGFAWCTTGIFNHPFRAQTRVKPTDHGRSSTMHRCHILDTLPFHSSALFQTEAWGLAPGTMDYESLILYYN